VLTKALKCAFMVTTNGGVGETTHEN